MLTSSEKRSRARDTDEDISPETKARRFENLARLSDDLVDRVASVNGDVIGSLLARWEQTTHDSMASRTRAAALEAQLVQSKEEQVRAELASVVAAKQLRHHTVLLDQMELKLQESASKAAESVVQQLDTLMTPALRRTAAQLEKERDINDALAAKVQQFLAHCMCTLQISSQRTLDAQLQTAERDVTIARLNASLAFEQGCTLRQSQETETLLRILRALAERTKGAEQAKQDLQRSKEHVRKLERHLDLNGIVAAISSGDTSSASSPASSSQPSASPATGTLASHSATMHTSRPAAPPKELKLSAPHYFALRMLQHTDMTLSDLVDAWERQESRIIAAETRYVELQEVAKRLREDAAHVHRQYVEEKQRREITDRRVTEMVLERVERDRAAATQTEISRLRANYTKVVDDASQLAVSLQTTRDTLNEAQARVSQLEAQVAQLQTDAAADEVASTICALRRQYEERIESVRADFVDAQTERQLALAIAESRGRDQQRAQEALLLSRENNTEMTSQLLEALKRGPYTHTRQQETAAKQDLEEARAALVDVTNRVHSAVGGLEDAHKIVSDDRTEALTEFQQQLAELTASFEALTTQSAPRKGSHGTQVGTEDLVVSVGAAEAASPSTQLREMQREESNKLMKHILQDGLEFIAGHLDVTEDQRNHLLDASISDAQYVSFMVDKLHRVTADRDRLRRELKRSYDLIELNHLTVVEHALMHDVSVEDSLNAAEAAEQIQALRHELEALQESRDAALSEVKNVRDDNGDVGARLAVSEREKSLLEAQVKRLTDALHSSFTRETTLHKRTIDLHARLEALAESHTDTTATSGTNVPEDGQDDATSPPPTLQRLEQMASRVSEQLTSCQQLLKERTEAEQKVAAASAAQTVKDLEEDLARCGLHKVSTLLYEALSGSQLLQSAVDLSTLRQRGHLSTCAVTPSDLTPEMKTAELELHNRQLQEELATLKEHRHQYELRLQTATDAISKSETHTKRLLEVSGRLIEDKKQLAAKVVTLQAEIDHLRATPSSLPAPVVAEATEVPAPTDVTDASVDPAAPPQVEQDSPQAEEEIAPAQDEMATSNAGTETEPASSGGDAS